MGRNASKWDRIVTMGSDLSYGPKWAQMGPMDAMGPTVPTGGRDDGRQAVGRADGRMCGWAVGQADGRLGGQSDGRTGGRTGGRIGVTVGRDC